jgi:hypothetical protein
MTSDNKMAMKARFSIDWDLSNGIVTARMRRAAARYTANSKPSAP